MSCNRHNFRKCRTVGREKRPVPAARGGASGFFLGLRQEKDPEGEGGDLFGHLLGGAVGELREPLRDQGEEAPGEKLGDDVDFPENIGIIIETPEFVPYLSGYENLKMLAGCRKKIGKEQICEAMEQVELDWKNKLHVKKYSLGMRQRLGLAQAIMEKPEILVLDEPFNGLDDDGVSKMRELLLKKRKKELQLLFLHTMQRIFRFCVIRFIGCIEGR